MRDLNLKEIDKIGDNNTINYIGIIESSKKIIVYECKSHGIIEQRFDVHLKNNKKCSKCPRDKKIYTKEYIESLVEKRLKKYKVIFEKDVYGVKEKITLFCEDHGEFKQTIHNHFNIGNNCPKCSKKEFKLNEDFIDMIKNHGIELISYKGYKKLSTFKCEKHGIFEKDFENVKRYGCSHCSKYKKYNNNKNNFIKKSKMKWGGLINFDYKKLVYNGMSKKMKIYSDDTGWIEQVAQNHINGFLPKSSSGEIIIKKILENLKINYIEQKTFDDCKNLIKLRFDFYLPDYNICIEYNGIQHYKPIDFFGGENRYKSQMINDEIKNKYCILNNIKLIVISYKDNIIDKINETYAELKTK